MCNSYFFISSNNFIFSIIKIKKNMLPNLSFINKNYKKRLIAAAAEWHKYKWFQGHIDKADENFDYIESKRLYLMQNKIFERYLAIVMTLPPDIRQFLEDNKNNHYDL